MNRQLAIHAAVRQLAIYDASLHSAIRNGNPEHIARDLAARAVRRYNSGHSASRAIRLTTPTRNHP